MGPRLQERGVLLAITLANDQNIMLQWGRAYKSAELPHPARKKDLHFLGLQWGRAYKSAELGVVVMGHPCP